MTRRALAFAVTAFVAGSAAPGVAQSLRLGDSIRVEPKARLQVDMRAPEGDDVVELDVPRRRIGVSGRVTRYVEFEVERDVDSDGRWRDAFVDVRASAALRVRAGQFKVPFSREQLTSPGHLDFIDRSRAADLVAPGRSTGIAVHGRVAHRIVGYEVGVFVRDGTHGGLGGVAASEPTAAARLTVRPLKRLEIGAAGASSELRDGRPSLHGRLTSSDRFFSPVLVNGRRRRVGGDLDWRPGPFGVRGEFLRADDERRHQGLMGETLAPLRAQGWSVSGVWAVAGRAARARADDSFAVRGLDGLELAVRAEQLSFGTPDALDGQVWTPRAEQLSSVTDRAWTVGVTWTLNRIVRIQGNAVRESIVNRARGATTPRAGWSPVARVQVAM